MRHNHTQTELAALPKEAADRRCRETVILINIETHLVRHVVLGDLSSLKYSSCQLAEEECSQSVGQSLVASGQTEKH
jgi:hypothetical protein